MSLLALFFSCGNFTYRYHSTLLKMKNAAFLGTHGWPLERAYSPALRDSIIKKVRLAKVIIEPERWQEQRDVLGQTELLFSSWGMPKLDAAFLAAAPKLEAIFYAAGGIKGFATPQSYERGIVICSAWQANAIPVAEYSLATILLSLKRFWHATRSDIYAFHEQYRDVPGAYQSTVGLLSLGAIGCATAKLLALHEVRLIAHDPYSNPTLAAELGIELVSLEELFARSDVVSIHTPWLPETEGLVKGHLVRSMKTWATLINTSRGAVINEPELCAALAERPDLTAVLDVTFPEPPAQDSPLRSLPNVIRTPHIAGSMGGEIARMGQWMVEEMERYLAGQPLRYAISKEMMERMA